MTARRRRGGEEDTSVMIESPVLPGKARPAPPAMCVPPDGEERHHAEGYRVSVIIPALNEAVNIPHVVARIPTWVHEVILVDGHSTDGTTDVARTVWPNHHIVLR